MRTRTLWLAFLLFVLLRGHHDQLNSEEAIAKTSLWGKVGVVSPQAAHQAFELQPVESYSQDFDSTPLLRQAVHSSHQVRDGEYSEGSIVEVYEVPCDYEGEFSSLLEVRARVELLYGSQSCSPRIPSSATSSTDISPRAVRKLCSAMEWGFMARPEQAEAKDKFQKSLKSIQTKSESTSRASTEGQGERQGFFRTANASQYVPAAHDDAISTAGHAGHANGSARDEPRQGVATAASGSSSRPVRPCPNPDVLGAQHADDAGPGALCTNSWVLLQASSALPQPRCPGCPTCR
eukprot:s1471_g4.t1